MKKPKKQSKKKKSEYLDIHDMTQSPFWEADKPIPERLACGAYDEIAAKLYRKNKKENP